MKYILTAFLAFTLSTLPAQPTPVGKWEYCQITYATNSFNSSTTVTVDYGDKVTKALGGKSTLQDPTGADQFKSPIAAYNYLGELGWECFNTLAGAEFGKLTVAMFKRKKA